MFKNKYVEDRLATLFKDVKDGVYRDPDHFDELGILLDFYPEYYWTRYKDRIEIRKRLPDDPEPVSDRLKLINVRNNLSNWVYHRYLPNQEAALDLLAQIMEQLNL